MHTIYNNFLRKFEFKDVVYYVPQILPVLGSVI